MASRTDEVGRPGPADWEEGESPDQIERDIEQTRANMTETVNAIEAKLSPERLKEQALEGAKDAAEQLKNSVVESARQATQEAVDTAQSVTQERTEAVVNNVVDSLGDVVDLVRRHPVPAAVAALGIGWLIMEERGGSGPARSGYSRPYSYASGRGERYDQRGYTSYAPGAERAGAGPSPYSYQGAGEDEGMLDDAKRQAQHLASDAQGAVQDAKEKVADVATDARQKVDQALSRVDDTRQDLSWEMRYQAERLPGRLEQMVHDNPLAVGLIALGIGAAIGAALPETETENRLMGEARDDLARRTEQVVQRAQGALEETVAEAKSAAENVKQTAKQEIEDKHLVEKVKSAAEETVQSAKQAVESTTESAKSEAKDLANEASDAAQDVKSAAKDQTKGAGSSGSYGNT